MASIEEGKAAGIMTTTMEVEAVKESEEPTKPGLMVVQGDEYVRHDGPPPRKSHICCGCCCDTRKAVIVVNIINLCLLVMAVLSISVVASDKFATQYDDDELRAAMDQIDGVVLGVTIGFAVAGTIASGVAIYGAAKYHQIAVVVGAVWYVIDFVRSLVFFDIGGAIMAGCFCYPHVILYKEIRNGIMSEETYVNEKHCCECGCCG